MHPRLAREGQKPLTPAHWQAGSPAYSKRKDRETPPIGAKKENWDHHLNSEAHGEINELYQKMRRKFDIAKIPQIRRGKSKYQMGTQLER